jgi:HSP90 family molecular chaperone
VIDCRDLPLTLSRESVIDGSVMRALREQLRDAVLEQLGRLRHRGPRSFRQVLRAYNRPFKMAALRDNRVLERFADELDVKLTTGETMSLAQVTEKSGGGGITFIDNAETQSAHGSLLAARGKPVVDATDRLDWILLQRYGHAKGKAPERADVSAGTLGRLAEGEPWRTLERAVAAIDPTVQPRAVEMDAEVPALFLRGERDVLQDMLAEARERGEGHPAVRLLSGLLSDPQGANAGRPLFLNSRHPVVQAMASALRSSADPGLIRTAIRALIASATAYSEPMDPARRKNVYDAVSECLLALLTLADSGDAAGADRDLAAKVKQLEADNAQLRARAEAAEQELRAVPPPLLHRFRRSPPQAP